MNNIPEKEPHPGWGVLVLVVITAGFAGWVLNLIKIFGCDSIGCATGRFIGAIVAPVGALMGWF